MDIDALCAGFATRLTQERNRQSLSQVAVARVGAVTKPTQLAYEQGTRLPGLDYLMRLAVAGFDFWFLVWGVREKAHVLHTFDWQLLGEIEEDMQRWILDNDLDVPPRKRVEFARVLYELSQGKDKLTREDVARVLRLAA